MGFHQAGDSGLAYLDLECDDPNEGRVIKKSSDSLVAHLQASPSMKEERPAVGKGVIEAIENIELPEI